MEGDSVKGNCSQTNGNGTNGCAKKRQQQFDIKPFHEIANPKIMFYLKPWDDEVFKEFFEVLKYVTNINLYTPNRFLQERTRERKIGYLMEQWLFDELREAKDEVEKHGLILDELQVFNCKDEEMKQNIQYLITFGGDGTILYAAKQFHKDYIPPIIAFSFVSK